MSEFIEILKIGAQWSPTGILTLVIILVLKGALITSRQYSDARADWQRQLDGKDEEIKTWREAYYKSEDVREKVAEVIATQTNDLNTVLHFIQAATLKNS